MIHVIEDEENIRKLVTVNLTRRGHEVVEASNAKEALTHLEHLKPDLMILNIKLPDLSGLEILDHLDRKFPSSINSPVILITGTMIDNAAILARYPRVIRIFTKPFDINELIAFVHATLSGKENTSL
jgi:DNA-binding response OmpR family regulator